MAWSITFAEPFCVDTTLPYNSARNGTRKKRFSPKTTTGCLTCRRRRVKCDETKPECQRCLGGGHRCLGYLTRQIKVFEHREAKLDASPRSSSDSSGDRDDYVSANNPGDRQIAPPNIVSSRPRAVSLSSSSQPFTFYSDDEARAFSIWITKIAPMLVNYGPASSDLWPKLIPQTAWEFKSVRELFLAIASTDDQFRTSVPRSSLKYKSNIIARYNKAIYHLRSGETGELETFFASILGWALETYQGNYKAGGMHIKVAMKLAKEILSTSDGKVYMGHDVRDMLTSCLPNLLRCKAYTDLALTDPKSLLSHKSGLPSRLVQLMHILSSKEYTFRSVAEAHEMLVQLLESPDYFSTHSGSIAYILRQWDVANTAFRVRETEPSLLHLANHLLWSLAMSLPPDVQVCDWNEAAPGQILDHVYTLSRQYMEASRDLDVEHRKQLLRILQVLLQKSVQFYPQDELVVQLQILLVTVGGSLRGLESQALPDVSVSTLPSVANLALRSSSLSTLSEDWQDIS